MKPQKAVIQETKCIALGTLALTALLLIVYALCGKFSALALGGGAYGAAVAVLNFFALGITVQGSVSGIQGENESEASRAKAHMQLSYSMRMLGVFGLEVLAIVVLKLEPLAALLPLLFPRMTIAAMQLGSVVARKKEKQDEH